MNNSYKTAFDGKAKKNLFLIKTEDFHVHEFYTIEKSICKFF